jgi:hypothetical protein
MGKEVKRLLKSKKKPHDRDTSLVTFRVVTIFFLNHSDQILFGTVVVKRNEKIKNEK